MDNLHLRARPISASMRRHVLTRTCTYANALRIRREDTVRAVRLAQDELDLTGDTARAIEAGLSYMNARFDDRLSSWPCAKWRALKGLASRFWVPAVWVVLIVCVIRVGGMILGWWS